jgi:hypothetical protein
MTVLNFCVYTIRHLSLSEEITSKEKNIESVQFKTKPNNNYILWYKVKVGAGSPVS